MKVITENSVCIKFDIYFFSILISLGRYLGWWAISPEGIIRPVVSDSELTWFNRYIYYCNLQFLNNVINNKTKVLLPQAKVTLAEFGYPV
jgi:hypothetical protein